MASPHVHSSTATTTTTTTPTNPAHVDPSLALAGLHHQFRQLPSSFAFPQQQQPPPLPQQQQQQQQSLSEQQEAIARRQSLHQPMRPEPLMDGPGPLIPNISPAHSVQPHYPQTNLPQATPGQTSMTMPMARPPLTPGSMHPIGGIGGFGMTMPVMTAAFHRPNPQVQPNPGLARGQIQPGNQIHQDFQPVFPGQPQPHALHAPQQPLPNHNPIFNPSANPSMQHPMQPGQSLASQRLQPQQGPSSHPQPPIGASHPSHQPPPPEGPRTPLMGSLSQPPPISLARNMPPGPHPPHIQHPPQRLANSPPIPRPPSQINAQRTSFSMPVGSPSQGPHSYVQQGSGSQMQEVVQGSPQIQRRPSSQGFYRSGSNPITPQMQPLQMNVPGSAQSVPGSSMAMVMPNGRSQPPHSDYQGSSHSQEHSPHDSSPRGQTAINEDGQPRSASLPVVPRPFTSGPGGGAPQMNTMIRQSSGNAHLALHPPIGFGQALMFVLQFVGALDFESPNCQHLEYWNTVVQDFFHPQGSMRFTLWKDNAGKEAKPFDVGFKILPRFFLVTVECGVVGMSFSVDGATERLESTMAGSPPSSVVECKSASWTYRYKSGYTVVLRGPLVAHVQLDTTSSGLHPRYLIKGFNFNASNHERCISIDVIQGRRLSPPQVSAEELARSRNGSETEIKYESATLPPEPVNAFGIPQKTMRCLEAGSLLTDRTTITNKLKLQLAESCELMSDLMDYSSHKNMGPIDALKKMSDELRINHPLFADVARRVASAGTFTQATHSSSAISGPSNNSLMKASPSPASTSSPIKTPAIAPAVVPPITNDVKPTISTAPSGIAPATAVNVTGTGKRKLSNAESPKRTKPRGNQRAKGR